MLQGTLEVNGRMFALVVDRLYDLPAERGRRGGWYRKAVYEVFADGHRMEVGETDGLPPAEGEHPSDLHAYQSMIPFVLGYAAVTPLDEEALQADMEAEAAWDAADREEARRFAEEQARKAAAEAELAEWLDAEWPIETRESD